MKTMKKILLLILLSLVNVAYSQINSSNSVMAKAVIEFYKGDDGFYHSRTDSVVKEINDIKKYYAYDSKARNLYILTDRGNFVATISKDFAKAIKKNPLVPQLKLEDAKNACKSATEEISNRYLKVNDIRRKHIEDSILQRKRDSVHLSEIRQDVLCRDELINKRNQEVTAKQIKEQEYFESKKDRWAWAPSRGLTIKCDDCGESFTKDSLFLLAASKDSIYFLNSSMGDIDVVRTTVHSASISSSMRANEHFANHLRVFKDSLLSKLGDFQGYVEEGNGYFAYSYLKNLQKKAPYGYVDAWHWDDKYGMVAFDITYMNTNDKTIKYLEVYFSITNDVGDVRKTGVFQGTGPVESFSSGSWDWDSSHYFVSGDATHMQITKLIITYMNGSKVTIPKNKIVYN